MSKATETSELVTLPGDKTTPSPTSEREHIRAIAGSSVGPGSMEWQELLAHPRHAARLLQIRSIPDGPGVYAWFREGDCVYVGKASNLRMRLRAHLATSLDLSRSTLRSWVAVRELGLPREYTRRRPTAMTAVQVAVVNDWLSRCELTWVPTRSKDEADFLEASLLGSWRPPINVA